MTTDAPLSPQWWQWPTVLSLDAPAVVITWQWQFASVAGTAVRWPETFVVGASVWLAYAADRWFEGWRLTAATIRTPRHRFYHDHRWPVAIIWLAVLAADLAVSLAELSPRELLAGVLLLTPTLLYLLSHQVLHRDHPWRVPKELCVAALIAGGASVCVVATPGLALWPLLIPVGLFVALCLANVALIAAWEEHVDETHDQVSLARQFRHGAKLGRILSVALGTAALIAAVAHRDLSGTGGCVAASCVLLLIIDWQEPRIGWQLSRVLVDAALLTPLVFLLRPLFK